MWCANCRHDSLACDRAQSTAEIVAYECWRCGHHETEKRHNPCLNDFPAGSYHWITPEYFVAGGWALRHKTVWTEGHTGHHNEGGGAIRRLMQVLSVEIEPDHNYRWTTFDFETCTLHHTTCWGAGPAMFVFLDEEK